MAEEGEGQAEGLHSEEDEAAVLNSFAALAARAVLSVEAGTHLRALRAELTRDGLTEPQIDIVFGAAIAYWAARAQVQGGEQLGAGVVLAGVGAALSYWQYSSAVAEAARDGNATYWVFPGLILAGAILAFRGFLQLSSDISRRRMCQREMARLTSAPGDLVPVMRLVLARLNQVAT